MSNNMAAPLATEVTDSELMTRLAAGDDLSLNTLMIRWRDRVAAFLYRMTSHSETAADLAQETFVKLYQARKRYRPEGKFSTYLFAIATNLGRNHARWKMRHPSVSLDEESNAAEAIDLSQTPAEAAITAEHMKSVQAAFNSLPPDLREAMVLFIYEDLSYADIAASVNCSVKAAETRIYRARQLLKEQLKEMRA